jgi:hypothetical protein
VYATYLPQPTQESQAPYPRLHSQPIAGDIHPNHPGTHSKDIPGPYAPYSNPPHHHSLKGRGLEIGLLSVDRMIYIDVDRCMWIGCMFPVPMVGHPWHREPLYLERERSGHKQNIARGYPEDKGRIEAIFLREVAALAQKQEG